ncbi:hypothetical protein HMI55_004777 [Coelomomyces lativittatus]|nr:hypothetical protein HMI55_004777 [Coelomomyces lativittatus]
MEEIHLGSLKETTLAWDKLTGEPLYNAIVWHDTRTTGLVESVIQRTPSQSNLHFSKETGLPISTYFSALKMRWMLDHVESVKKADSENTLLFGTMDSWLIYNLLGGVSTNALHATDVTNASRTQLLNITTLNWSQTMLEFYDIPAETLPKIFPSSHIYGIISAGTNLDGIPITGCLGDQQAALVGQSCMNPGEAKCTLGTGGFLMINTGTQQEHVPGFLTTVGYHFPTLGSAVYALEGSIASVGTSLQFLKQLHLIQDMDELNRLAESVPPQVQDMYFVPAFSGLLSPYWHPNARALLMGMHLGITKADLCCCFLESIAFQISDLVHLHPISVLKVDGGVSHSNLTMQFISDYSNVHVLRPSMQESTALGAAVAAGLALGWVCQWKDLNPTRFVPMCSKEVQKKRLKKWKNAVERSMNWVDDED